MKRFMMIILVCVLTVLMIPVSAADEMEKEDPVVIEPRYEACLTFSSDFHIYGNIATISTDYVGLNTFSYVRLYHYIDKKVADAWVKPTTSKPCSWVETFYERSNVVENSLTLTSRGTYRGRAIAYFYAQNGLYDKLEGGNQAIY